MDDEVQKPEAYFEKPPDPQEMLKTVRGLIE